jgi:hypothetical protein
MVRLTWAYPPSKLGEVRVNIVQVYDMNSFECNRCELIRGKLFLEAVEYPDDSLSYTEKHPNFHPDRLSISRRWRKEDQELRAVLCCLDNPFVEIVSVFDVFTIEKRVGAT